MEETFNHFGIKEEDFERSVEAHYRDSEVQKLLSVLKPKIPSTTKLPDNLTAKKMGEIL
jgi:hypothetical protein